MSAAVSLGPLAEHPPANPYPPPDDQYPTMAAAMLGGLDGRLKCRSTPATAVAHNDGPPRHLLRIHTTRGSIPLNANP